MVANMLLQVFLLVEFKKLVTQAAVHSMRVAYNKYQGKMYDPPFDTTANGYRRGHPGNFRPERFQELSASQKELLCSFPLSQPVYLGAVLAIWTFTVVADVRKILFLAELILLRIPHVDSFGDMLEHHNDDKTMFLVGLPRSIRWVLFFMMFLPRMTIDIILIWLGCRWLVATASFADVLLNAMALEFLLVLKDLLYIAVVPQRDKLETRQMLIDNKKEDGPTYFGYLGSFGWILIVICWVYLYMRHLQTVLPDYRWDIQDVCRSYIIQNTKV